MKIRLFWIVSLFPCFSKYPSQHSTQPFSNENLFGKGYNPLIIVQYSLTFRKLLLLLFQQISCVFLHLVLHYFLLTNYAWMLCEGFYLHTVLVSAFVSEQKLVRWLIALGWTSPIVILIIYGLLRGLIGDEEAHKECWANASIYNNALIVPVCFSIMLNLTFLCNIVRVVLLKMKAPSGMGQGPSRTIIQAVR